MPHIATIESSTNESNKIQQGVVNLVLFDGASNVQKARRIMAIHHPRITVVHGAEHVTSLFFKDVYTNVSPVRCNSSQTNCAAVLILFCQSLFKALSNFGKWLQNVFRSCRHVPMAMLRKYSKAHNRGIFVGFIKSLGYRMAGNTLLYAVSCV